MRIYSLIAGLCCLISSWAQQNDSSLLRELAVVEVQKYVVVHAFIGEKDSCLFYQRTLDSLQRTISEEVDFSCYGFKDQEITYYSYGESRMSSSLADAQGPLESTSYELTDRGLVKSMVTNHYRTNDSSFTYYEYFFSNHRQPDSSIMLHIDQQKDTLWQKTIARFDKYGQAVQVIAVDQKDNLLSQMSTEFKDSGVVASIANTIYGEKPSFSQTYFEHDQNDRTVVTYNNINQRQEFFYREDGLLSNIFNYNPKGELESEIIYRYKFK